MENNTVQINGFEMLGRVLDGNAGVKERKSVLLNMADAVFEEFFMAAMRAMVLFNDKMDAYDTGKQDFR